MKEKSFLTRITGIFTYLFDKRSELQDLDYTDALLAQANIRIYRTTTHKTMVMVPLKRLRPLHRLERENAQNVMCERVNILKEHREEMVADNMIKSETLNEYLPSVSALRVIQDRKGDFIAFEGNGRIAALKEVFDMRDDLNVEVEQYHFKKTKSILRILNRLRRVNGVLTQ